MLYIDAHGNLREPGSKAPIWGMGIPVTYRSGIYEVGDFEIWPIPKTYFTNICPNQYPAGKHPDDPLPPTEPLTI